MTASLKQHQIRAHEYFLSISARTPHAHPLRLHCEPAVPLRLRKAAEEAAGWRARCGRCCRGSSGAGALRRFGEGRGEGGEVARARAAGRGARGGCRAGGVAQLLRVHLRAARAHGRLRRAPSARRRALLHGRRRARDRRRGGAPDQRAVLRRVVRRARDLGAQPLRGAQVHAHRARAVRGRVPSHCGQAGPLRRARPAARADCAGGLRVGVLRGGICPSRGAGCE